MISRRGFLGSVGVAAAGSFWLPYGTLPAWAQVSRPTMGGPKDFPAPAKTVRVTDSSGLARALAEAAPGTHILLAPGSYGGRFTADAKGTGENPIVIRSEGFDRTKPTDFPAKIAGSIDLAGTDLILHGVECEDAKDFAVDISGQRCKVLRCSLPGRHGIAINDSATHWHIGCSSFTGGTSGGKARQDNIIVFVSRHGSEPGLIDRCSFQGGNGDDSESHAIYVAQHFDESRPYLNIQIQHNLIGTKDEPFGKRRSIYCKRGCNIMHNMVWVRRGTFGFRSGAKGTMAGNSVHGAHDITLNGPGHKVLGNEWTSTRFDAMADASSRAGNKYQAVDDAIFAGNSGDLNINAIPGGGKRRKSAFNVQIFDHEGKVNGGSAGKGDAAPSYPEPVVLTEAMVGPGAPDNLNDPIIAGNGTDVPAPTLAGEGRRIAVPQPPRIGGGARNTPRLPTIGQVQPDGSRRFAIGSLSRTGPSVGGSTGGGGGGSAGVGGGGGAVRSVLAKSPLDKPEIASLLPDWIRSGG